jgi:hypothetical protein
MPDAPPLNQSVGDMPLFALRLHNSKDNTIVSFRTPEAQKSSGPRNLRNPYPHPTRQRVCNLRRS